MKLYHQGRSFFEIGKKLGFSKSCAQQTYAEGLRVLRRLVGGTEKIDCDGFSGHKSKRLAILRQARGLTQVQLAENTGFNATSGIILRLRQGGAEFGEVAGVPRAIL